MRTSTTAGARGRGFSMIEVMISVAILAIIALAIYALLEAGTNSYNTTTRKDTLQQNARTALEQIAAELRMANPTTIVTTPVASGNLNINGSNLLTFRQSVNYTPPTVDIVTGEPAIDPATNLPYTGVTTYGDDISYFLETSTADANNNGVQDEARLVRTAWYVIEGVKVQRKSTVCEYVRQGGFVITDNGNDTITITLRLRVVDGRELAGSVKNLDVSAATTVLMRNRKI